MIKLISPECMHLFQTVGNKAKVVQMNTMLIILILSILLKKFFVFSLTKYEPFNFFDYDLIRNY